MSGRRSHQRFDVHPASTGTLRVNKDIVVQRFGPDELIVTSREPAIPNERMLLHLSDGDPSTGVRVKVVDSQPVIVQGAVRHLVRLHVVGVMSASDDTSHVNISRNSISGNSGGVNG